MILSKNFHTGSTVAIQREDGSNWTHGTTIKHGTNYQNDGLSWINDYMHFKWYNITHKHNNTNVYSIVEYSKANNEQERCNWEKRLQKETANKPTIKDR